MLGTRDYLGKNGFTDAVIGLSGGVDSSLVAAVAVDALGAEHVHGLSMPLALFERGVAPATPPRWPSISGSTSAPSPSRPPTGPWRSSSARCSELRPRG